MAPDSAMPKAVPVCHEVNIRPGSVSVVQAPKEVTQKYLVGEQG